ncbi:MAG: glucose-6-phosphate isomerase [Wenzhouxiangellaceae bacterium]|nr:glucose-6-phosphate isomerase [Wenzhouxiangellaceae bacterium]
MTDIRDLLAREPERVHAMLAQSAHWRADFSRIPLDLNQWQALIAADALEPVQRAVQALFAGGIVNPSERQPALHMALRADDPATLCRSEDSAQVRDARDRLLDYAGRLYRGETPIQTILHAGIGGSDLGPRLVTEALDPGDSAVEIEWLTTLDARRIRRLLDRLDPATTGLVIASKSFSTVETLTQARVIRDWLGDEAGARIWAATANPERAVEFGVVPEHVLAFPGWTGGRYSLWSSVGFSAAARLGPERWQALLAGARAADRQLLEQLAESPAFALAQALDRLVREHGCATLGVVSYAPELRLLAEFLQQLVMESLGKGVDLANRPVAGPTSPLVFGGAGTDLQHSLFQALHQGTTRHPMVLIGSVEPVAGLEDWQREQLAHLLGQASALVHGRQAERPEQTLPGNNPVITLLTRRVDAEAVGELIAQFEHAVYLLSVLWQINAFDQWGVEEGKRLAGEFRAALAGERDCPDASLTELLQWLREAH